MVSFFLRVFYPRLFFLENEASFRLGAKLAKKDGWKSAIPRDTNDTKNALNKPLVRHKISSLCFIYIYHNKHQVRCIKKCWRTIPGRYLTVVLVISQRSNAIKISLNTVQHRGALTCCSDSIWVVCAMFMRCNHLIQQIFSRRTFYTLYMEVFWRESLSKPTLAYTQLSYSDQAFFQSNLDLEI